MNNASSRKGLFVVKIISVVYSTNHFNSCRNYTHPMYSFVNFLTFQANVFTFREICLKWVKTKSYL